MTCCIIEENKDMGEDCGGGGGGIDRTQLMTQLGVGVGVGGGGGEVVKEGGGRRRWRQKNVG